MRRAARVDENQSELIRVLERCGATVYEIKEPVDLLIGYMGLSCAAEVKNPKRRGRKIRTKQQIEFFAEFRGMKAEIKTVEDCLELLAKMRAIADAISGTNCRIRNFDCA